ncbi:MAG: galactose-1-phosphate uridylyltransferase [Actinobacteria bacterium]|nr:galactose-1-phosphate uridylyltransferase [Actinomycetota bacterium]
MLELRHNPILNEKVAYATKRQERTFHPPKDYCPLCPTRDKEFITEIPNKTYDIVVFENKFPTFIEKPLKPDLEFTHPYMLKESKGICEVICYLEEHDKYLEDQPINKIKNLIKVWADRYYFLGNKDFIKYVFIFENKGKEIGVTLSHPHGQIYAFSYIPPVLKKELENSKRYYRRNNSCLHCQIIKEEINGKERIVIQNEDFIAFIPYYARWPYEVHLYSLRHIGSICDLNDNEIFSLSQILKNLINKYNALFNFRMPYVMIVHQIPTDGKDYPYYHLHFEFYPPYRTKNKLKYLAGCELGAGTFINDTLPEERAAELRSIILEK